MRTASPDSAPPRIAFDRNELSGAFGDIGTDLPLIIAMIPAAGLDTASVFTTFGLMQILMGLLYGLPMPMQPLKAMAVIVITERLAGPTLFGAGLAIGAAMLVLAGSGLLGWLARVIPHHVVRGVQLGLALSLGSLALKNYVPAMGAPGYAMAAACFVIVVVLMGNRRFPPALPVVGLGVVAALLGQVDGGAILSSVGFRAPAVHVPSLRDIAAGAVLLALPQLPLSLSNSVIATHKTLGDLFPGRAISIRTIGGTYALVNLVVPFLGGIPLCHGSGGLAGHHAFGARTGGSVVVYGSMYLVVGLLFSGAAEEVVRLFPYPVLGVILLFEALALAALVRDVAESRRGLAIAILVALVAVGLPQGYVIGLVAGTLLSWVSGRLPVFREPAV